MEYARHEQLVKSARVRPALWRVAVGVLILVGGQFAAVGVLVACVATLSAPELVTSRILGLMTPTTPWATLLILTTFLGLGLGTWFAGRVLHKRGLASLFGHGPTALRHFAVAATTILLLFGTLLLVWPIDMRPGLPFGQWIVFLPLALIAVLIQTGAEELAFRGYLQPQLAARFGRPAVWLLLPALAFGALHYAPQIQGQTAVLVMGAATLFGVIAGDLTARTGTIGAAWGFHFANNTLAILVIATPGALSGLALRLQPNDITVLPDPATIAAELILLMAGWFLLCRILRV